MDVDAEYRVRKALARVVTDGLVPYTVLDEGWPLLELEIVHSRVETHDDTSENDRAVAYTKALTTVLQEAVESDRISGKSRRLLRAVLPLKPEYLGRSVKERRIAAGKEMKDGKKVQPGTIRTYYEPKALDKLTEVLLEMERTFNEQRNRR
jgi:hypothetical protein